MVLDFQFGIFQMAEEILEGIETMPSFPMAQVVADVDACENSCKLITLQFQLSNKAIIVFLD